MGTAPYDGMFLAPESIVIVPGFAASALGAPADASPAERAGDGTRGEALTDGSAGRVAA